VVARCRGQGLRLTANEFDLIDAWFAGAVLGSSGPARLAPPSAEAGSPALTTPEGRSGRWWSLDDGRAHNLEPPAEAQASGQGIGEEFPRIARGRLRG
jgi:hypothetical protein